LPTRIVATIDGVEQELEIEELSGHALRFAIGAQTFDVDYRFSRDSAISILVGKRIFDFEVSRHSEDLLVTSRGTSVRVNIVDAARRVRGGGARTHADGRAEIKAMMPGRVVNVLVKVGEEVSAHQGVVVVEAMKMENEVKSPKAGRVAEIKIAAGQTVEKGALLVIIE
jgi:biotin carboxyl carrier protein